MAKIKTATSFLKKRSGTQFYHDQKPMLSIIDILYKISRRTIQVQGDFQDFQELQTPCSHPILLNQILVASTLDGWGLLGSPRVVWLGTDQQG